MSLKRIVVGIDMSELGAVALERAAGLADAFGAEVVIVHATGVTDTGIYVHDHTGRDEEPWKRYVTERVAEAGRQLEAAADDLRERGIGATARLVDGFPDAVITNVAAEGKADLVVVGTHGRTGMERWLLGSVAERVVRMVDRDVLVVRDGSSPAGPPSRVLVATDFSPIAEEGMRLALAVTAPAAKIEVLNCWQAPFGEDAPAAVRDQLSREGHEAAEALMARHDLGDREITFRREESSAASGILQRLEDGEFEAAFVGSHGRRGLRRALLGSVAEQVVRYAPCSVYVAHPRS